jgi:hypothetical protein
MRFAAANSQSTLLRVATEWIRGHDAFHLYDLHEASLRAKVDQTLAFTTFSEVMESRLLGLLANSQASTARDLIRLTLPDLAPDGGNATAPELGNNCYVPPIVTLRPEDIASIGADLGTAAALMQLSQRVTQGDSPESRLSSYLQNTGGLLSSPTGDYTDHHLQVITLIPLRISR